MQSTDYLVSLHISEIWTEIRAESTYREKKERTHLHVSAQGGRISTATEASTEASISLENIAVERPLGSASL